MGNNILLHVLYIQGHSTSFQGNHREPFLVSPLRHLSMSGTCSCLHSIPLFPFTTRFQRLSMLSVTTASPTSSLMLTPTRLALLPPQQDCTCQSHHGPPHGQIPRSLQWPHFPQLGRATDIVYCNFFLETLSSLAPRMSLSEYHPASLAIPCRSPLTALPHLPDLQMLGNTSTQPAFLLSLHSDLIQAYALNASYMWMALGPTPVQTSPQNSRPVCMSTCLLGTL